MPRVIPHLQEIPGDVRAFWKKPEADRLRISWLGQAGYALRLEGRRMLIDPYLSNSLEAKYAGTDKPHPRMTPIPIEPEALTGMDDVLVTHRHTDHFDAATLVPLARTNPACRFLLPRAELKFALGCGLKERNLRLIDAGEGINLQPDIRVSAVAAAHEALDQDDSGRYLYLGYIIQCPGFTLYHSGDTILYPGLIDYLKQWEIDLAFLPVNGRGKGVPGNMNFAEAIGLCTALGIPHLIPHHFEMFAFNTVDRGVLARQAARTTSPRCHLPRMDHFFELTSG